jgi:hypothetical protein
MQLVGEIDVANSIQGVDLGADNPRGVKSLIAKQIRDSTSESGFEVQRDLLVDGAAI